MCEFKEVVRKCSDIGLHAVDRSRERSCVHATGFCKATCFNVKLEKAFGHTIEPKDVKNDLAWETLTGDSFKAWNARRKVARFRFCTRGEAFASLADVDRVADVLAKNPEVLFWIPTRAWRNSEYREAIELKVLPLANARVLASLDPSNDNQEVADIVESGWSTMFYGDDEATQDRILCDKTHAHVKGACATCSNGCFEAAFGFKQVHVHLNQH